ncbi:MAG: sugar transferase [Rhodobacteraceae bacterium]|nr:sugar transferase [Paracoccaceae bacterium]
MTVEKFSTDFLDAELVTIGEAIHSPPSRLFLIAKRMIDLGFAIMLLPVLGVISVLLLLVNRQFNPGPLFFDQERVGKDQQMFRIVKFRTMAGTCDECRFADTETDRINQVGRFLRRTRIDELPQILNVLIGQMSMVGPRPEQVEFYNLYVAEIPGYALRQHVRPGITGLAQLKYGYTSDVVGTARKLKWDLEYIRRMGFAIEGYIIWQTLLFVFQRLLNQRTRTKL